MIWNPVSKTAFFVAPVAVSPLTACSASVICKVTLSGNCTPNTSPSKLLIVAVSLSFKKFFSHSKFSAGISICSYVSPSINTNASPVLYKYCISFLSICALFTLSFPPNVISVVDPVRKFFILTLIFAAALAVLL